MADAEKILKQLTTEEKAALVAGTDFMHTNPVPRMKIRSLCMSDGPHGLRKQCEGSGDNGTSLSEPATAFPTAVAIASGWNAKNAKAMGEAIAEECIHYGVDILLGPGVNIKRNPLCGRNFEYFSEDPYLAGIMAASEIAGVQSKGVGVALKHFALNNSENFRFMGNSVCDERAAREIYLKPFEIAVKTSSPATVMCAYNRINGTFCSENEWLLTEVLRTEWGFDGLVMTDWGAIKNRPAAIEAGLDLEMPGDTTYCRASIVNGIKKGVLDKSKLDGCVGNLLKLIEKFPEREKVCADFKAHHALSARIAEDCAVLMKNDGFLPLDKNDKLYIVGDLFEKMRYQGAGSSMINPVYLTSPKSVFDERGANYCFARGYRENCTEPDEELIGQAVNGAKNYGKTIVFAGLTDYAESEGGDRKSFSLPANQLALINALIDAGKDVGVVVFGGSPYGLPFANGVKAILNMFLPGQNGGTAVYNLLYGESNPCGKLSESWADYSEVPFGGEFAKNVNEVYRESVFVGYRYYLTAGKKLDFPFGFGLSYTAFEFSDMRVERADGKISVRCMVTNVGERYGGEVVQLYVKSPAENVYRPERELKAFSKIYLGAGESGEVELNFSEDDLKYFDIKLHRWVLTEGEYTLAVCSDCQTVKLFNKIKIEGEKEGSPYSGRVLEIYSGLKFSEVTNEVFEEMSGLSIPPEPPLKPITVESPFSHLQYRAVGRIIYRAVMSVPKKLLKKAAKLPEGAERDNCVKGALFMMRILNSSCLRSMSMTAPILPYNYAEGIVKLANGNIFGGLGKFLVKIKAPKLPKDIKKQKQK